LVAREIWAVGSLMDGWRWLRVDGDDGAQWSRQQSLPEKIEKDLSGTVSSAV
jgi:hypothetical protein